MWMSRDCVLSGSVGFDPSLVVLLPAILKNLDRISFKIFRRKLVGSKSAGSFILNSLHGRGQRIEVIIWKKSLWRNPGLPFV